MYFGLFGFVLVCVGWVKNELILGQMGEAKNELIAGQRE